MIIGFVNIDILLLKVNRGSQANKQSTSGHPSMTWAIVVPWLDKNRVKLQWVIN